MTAGRGAEPPSGFPTAFERGAVAVEDGAVARLFGEERCNWELNPPPGRAQGFTDQSRP